MEESHSIGHFYAGPREIENATTSEGSMGLTVIKNDSLLSLSAVC